MAAGPLIEVDWTQFTPWRVQAVRHQLTTHPLLQLPALLEFSARQEKQGRVRSHSNNATAATPFNAAPSLHPNHRSATATVADLENANAWTSLLNIQCDEVYRNLVDEVLDGVQPNIDQHDPGMSYRAGWIFITSPSAVTPFHIDREHNFILQILGRKRIYVWEPDDEIAVSEEARDLFHAAHSRDKIIWRESLRERAHVFDLEPGMGAYMPSTSPHLVENFDNGSVTASFTYYTAATRRNSRVHTANHYLRKLGVVPRPVGHSQAGDGVKSGASTVLLTTKSLLRRMRGRSVRRSKGHYAQHLFS